MSGLIPLPPAGLDAAQGAEALSQAVELLKRANRYVGTNSSTRAMDLSVEITEFVAAYRRTQESTGGEISDNSPKTNPLEPAI